MPKYEIDLGDHEDSILQAVTYDLGGKTPNPERCLHWLVQCLLHDIAEGDPEIISRFQETRLDNTRDWKPDGWDDQPE